MKRYLILGILLVGLLVGTAGAATIRINATNASDSGILRDVTESPESLSVITSGEGSYLFSDPNTYGAVSLDSGSSSNTYLSLGRFGTIFDTSSLPDGCTINNATVYVYSPYAENGLGDIGLGLTGFTAGTPGQVSISDFQTVGSAPLSANVSWAEVAVGGYYGFILNSAGRSLVNSTAPTNLMFRSVWDIDRAYSGWTGTQSSYILLNTAENGGDTVPYIVVDYTEAGGGSAPVASFTSNVTSGTIPFVVQFTDTSTNTPTAWEWWVTNVETSETYPTFTTEQNPLVTGWIWSGNFSIHLNASNSEGYNISTQTTFLNVTKGTAPTTYPIPSVNDTFILPTSDTNLPPAGTTVYVNATPGEITSASVVMKGVSDVEDYTITSTEFSDGTHTMPVNTTDIRLVKFWYQAGVLETEPVYWDTTAFNLVPELLLKDDALVQVDYTTQQQTVRVSNATYSGYVHIDNTSINQWHTNYKIWDNATTEGFPQPFVLPALENKQVWLTIRVPEGQAAGTYTSTVSIESSSLQTKNVTVTVTVLPFTLVDATKDFGIYYLGAYNSTETSNLSEFRKPYVNYYAEMRDIKDHGIDYPLNTNLWGDAGTYLADFNTSLQVRQTIGYPTDKMFMQWDAVVAPADQGDLQSMIVSMGNIVKAYGFLQPYFGGYDEPDHTQALYERPSFTTIVKNGSSAYTSSNLYTTFADLGNYVNVSFEYNAGAGYNSTLRNQWHSLGRKIYIYGYPQVGSEYPETFRKNYGFTLVQSGYDGEMNFAYQVSNGQTLWNDYDTTDYAWEEGGHYVYYRDFVFAYPKTDGIIPTVAWEGMRDGVYDTRYYDTLVSWDGTNTTALGIVNAGISDGKDSSVIRNDLITQLLGSSGDATVSHFDMVTVTPTPTPTATPTTTTTTATPTPTATPTTTTTTATPTPTPTPTTTLGGYGAPSTLDGYYVGGAYQMTVDGMTFGGGTPEHVYTNATADYVVDTRTELLNALTDAASHPGRVIYVEQWANIDMLTSANVAIPASTTIASNRGQGGSPGGKIYTKTLGGGSLPTNILFRTSGSNVHITGLQLEGEMYPESMDGIIYKSYGLPVYASEAQYRTGLWVYNTGLEIDNCLLQGFAYADVYVDGVATSGRPHIHHNFINGSQNANEGYGINVGAYSSSETAQTDALIEGNVFNRNRHDVTGDGSDNEYYTVRYNRFLNPPNFTVQGYAHIDAHGDDGYSGQRYDIYSNTFESGNQPAIHQRGKSTIGMYVHNNDITEDPSQVNYYGTWMSTGISTPVYQTYYSPTGTGNMMVTDNRWNGNVYPFDTGILHYEAG